ncbi:TAXI family TRAP transporter solute-binding subunit [Novispirillum sp. DQ9]|uniref:TAXI family TRAP transporter solute-binding subunit n=1 Tax=Novispirillum sp. DQ9 TaxID=3398612 RepID=UPI003C7CBD8F
MRKSMIALAIAAAVAVPAAAMAQGQQFINILTGGTSGVYYPLGVALSQIYNEKIDGARASVQSTRASVENLNLIQTGRGELGLALGDSVAGAWEGDTELGFAGKLDKIRGISALYPNYIQIVASKDSGIRTLADLKGKRVSVGAPRSGTEVNARQLLTAAGMSYADFGRTEYLPFGESVELIKNRQLDATLQSVGLGAASIRDLASSVPISVVEIPAEVVEKVGSPAFISATIPANTYDGQTEDVRTAAIVNILVTSADVPEDIAYQMTKHLHENRDTLVNAHAAAKGISLDGALNAMPVPLHPGAQRYYQEKGVAK